MLKKFKRILFYNFLILFVLLGTIELTTRVMSWVTGSGFTLGLHEVDPHDQKIKDIYRWHPFTGFIFSQNIRFVGGHAKQTHETHLMTDSHGFLYDGKELTYKKQPDEIRIATIGGSTTANINLNYDENWPGLLGKYLQEAFPQKEFSIINAGVPGFDTSQSISNLALRVMPFKPDIVIIYHAYNDLKAIRPNSAFNPDYSHFHNTPYGFHKEPGLILKLLNNSMFFVRMRNSNREMQLKIDKLNKLNATDETEKRLDAVPAHAKDTFEQHIRSLVSIGQSGGAKMVLSTFATLNDTTLNYNNEETIRSLTELQQISLGSLKHFTPGLTLQGILDGINQYNELLRQVASSTNSNVVDNATRIPHEEKYFVDRVHFSVNGAELMAKSFYPTVVKILKSADLLADSRVPRNK